MQNNVFTDLNLPYFFQTVTGNKQYFFLGLTLIDILSKNSPLSAVRLNVLELFAEKIIPLDKASPSPHPDVYTRYVVTFTFTELHWCDQRPPNPKQSTVVWETE